MDEHLESDYEDKNGGITSIDENDDDYDEWDDYYDEDEID